MWDFLENIDINLLIDGDSTAVVNAGEKEISNPPVNIVNYSYLM